jgi:hypothetical protein
MTHKNTKNVMNLNFCSAECSLLRIEGFSCIVLYGGLGISTQVQFFFLSLFWSLDLLEMLDPGSVVGSGFHESGSTTLDVEHIIGDQPLVILIHVYCSGKFRQISCETSLFDTKTLFLIKRSLGPHILRLLGILLIQYFTSQIYPAKDRKTVPIGQVFS